MGFPFNISIQRQQQSIRPDTMYGLTTLGRQQGESIEWSDDSSIKDKLLTVMMIRHAWSLEDLSQQTRIPESIIQTCLEKMEKQELVTRNHRKFEKVAQNPIEDSRYVRTLLREEKEKGWLD